MYLLWDAQLLELINSNNIRFYVIICSQLHAVTYMYI